MPSDLDSVHSSHLEMFPVDYEIDFFNRIVNGQDGLENLMAFSRDSNGNQQLAGFVTARTFYLYECDPVDRALMDLNHVLLDHEQVTYILTLGVSSEYRRQGLASNLVQWVINRANELGCRAVYLHVIDYNSAAIAVYRKNCFSEIACRQSFYKIWSGRQPDPSREVFDAYLYAYIISTEIVRTPATLILAAFSPLRSLWTQFQSCLPCGTTRGTYFGSAELPSVPKIRKSLARSGSSTASDTAKQIPLWLNSLFSRKEAVRQQ